MNSTLELLTLLPLNFTMNNSFTVIKHCDHRLTLFKVSFNVYFSHKNI